MVVCVVLGRGGQGPCPVIDGAALAVRKVVDAAGLAGKQWAPRELRHSFVSLLSDARVPIESISRLVGRRSTTVTESIYRKQLRR